jgi:hypothetical protein
MLLAIPPILIEKTWLLSFRHNHPFMFQHLRCVLSILTHLVFGRLDGGTDITIGDSNKNEHYRYRDGVPGESKYLLGVQYR